MQPRVVRPARLSLPCCTPYAARHHPHVPLCYPLLGYDQAITTAFVPTTAAIRATLRLYQTRLSRRPPVGRLLKKFRLFTLRPPAAARSTWIDSPIRVTAPLTLPTLRRRRQLHSSQPLSPRPPLPRPRQHPTPRLCHPTLSPLPQTPPVRI